jgi:hypothetical protein
LRAFCAACQSDETAQEPPEPGEEAFEQAPEPHEQAADGPQQSPQDAHADIMREL